MLGHNDIAFNFELIAVARPGQSHHCPRAGQQNPEIARPPDQSPPSEPSSIPNTAGCPASRSFFARCGIPQLLPRCFSQPARKSTGKSVVSHISQKTSEMWGTRDYLWGRSFTGRSSLSLALLSGSSENSTRASLQVSPPVRVSLDSSACNPVSQSVFLR